VVSAYRLISRCAVRGGSPKLLLVAAPVVKNTCLAPHFHNISHQHPVAVAFPPKCQHRGAQTIPCQLRSLGSTPSYPSYMHRGPVAVVHTSSLRRWWVTPVWAGARLIVVTRGEACGWMLFMAVERNDRTEVKSSYASMRRYTQCPSDRAEECNCDLVTPLRPVAGRARLLRASGNGTRCNGTSWRLCPIYFGG
jgi:hypothetical protein